MTTTSHRTGDAVTMSAPRLRRVRQPLSGRSSLVLSLVSSLGVIVLWEVLSRSGVLDSRFFPPPSRVVVALVESLTSGELLGHVGMSVTRILVGFLMGAVPAVLIGLAIGLSSSVRAAVQPIIDATFPIPKLAILPLFILIFGLGEMSKYMVLAVTVFYIVVINTAEGVRHIDRTQLEVGASFGASRRMMFFDIALPAAMPMILAGLKLGMNVALLVIVAVEFTGADKGIGFLIWNSWQVLKVDDMYVGLATTAVLGYLVALIFSVLERFLVPWKRR